METRLLPEILQQPDGPLAEEILRACVHCGFCNATCPTYQLLGDELDGPRGRIYQIKQLLEGGPATETTLTHLDRCLTCRNCETTCPSGVRYARLLVMGRRQLERRVRRPWFERLKREGLRRFLLTPALFNTTVRLASGLRAMLPDSLRRQLPKPGTDKSRPEQRHGRRMLLLEGCVQPALAPEINAATARVLDRLGISLVSVPQAGCCGAVSWHLGKEAEGLAAMRRNIDAWWPEIETGVEAIVITASGCGVMVKEYGDCLAHDPEYADKAARVSALARDIAEVVAGEDISAWHHRESRHIAFHPPCTLQHGQRLVGVVEDILSRMGFELTPVQNAHLCCGSAGTYSLLQPEIAGRLRDDKLRNLRAGDPELIATANIGCQTHLAGGTSLPIVHWITLLDDWMAV